MSHVYLIAPYLQSMDEVDIPDLKLHKKILEKDGHVYPVQREIGSQDAQGNRQVNKKRSLGKEEKIAR